MSACASSRAHDEYGLRSPILRRVYCAPPPPALEGSLRQERLGEHQSGKGIARDKADLRTSLYKGGHGKRFIADERRQTEERAGTHWNLCEGSTARKRSNVSRRRSE